MIEPDCAGCTNSQDALPSARHHQQQLSSTQSTTTSITASKLTQQQTTSQSHKDLPSYTSPPISIHNPASPVSLQSKLSYFQHNNLQPLFGSHLLLAPSAAGSTALPLGPDAQFALTPDVRACVTATYLCVLIVNNTWLDCNLLETLCNSANQNSGKHDASDEHSNLSSSASRKQVEEEGQLDGASEASMNRLNGLESVLSELIAFAGGGGLPSHSDGADTTESDGSAPDGVYHPLPFYFRPEEMGSQKPKEAYVDKGGGSGGQDAGDIGATTLEKGQEEEEEEQQQQQEEDDDDGDGDFHNSKVTNNQHHLGRLRMASEPSEERATPAREQISLADSIGAKRVRVADSEKELDRRIVEHYLSTIPLQSQTTKHAIRQQADSLAKNGSSSGSGGSGGQAEVPGNVVGIGPTQAPSSGSLASWAGRPFRGWGSYSFWPAGTGSGAGNHQQVRHDEPQAQLGDQQKQRHQQQQQVQLLRPDRAEQYNDIVTNQSSLKQQSIGGSSQQQPEKSGFQVATETTGISATHNAIAPATNNNLNGVTRSGSSNSNNAADNNNSNSNQPLFGFSQTPTGPQNLPFVEHLVGGNNNNHHGTGVNNNNNNDEPSSEQKSPQPFGPQILRSTSTPTAGLLGIYEVSNPTNLGGSYAPPTLTTGSMQSKQQHHHHHHHHYHHHHLLQQQQQQQQHSMAPFHPEDQVADSGQQCKCNELDAKLASQLPSEDCRFRCSASSGSIISSTTPSLVSNDAVQLATATTFTAPTTTLGPSAKMSPLDVTFLLYTRKNRDQTTGDTIGLIQTNETSLMGPTADPLASSGIHTTLRLNSSLPIKIVIHGFGSGGRRPWVTDMVYKLLDYEDANVIVVDWEKGATMPNYVQAAGNTRLVGHKIASLIKSINAKYGLTGNSYHLIGFSLGAHVAGFAGMEIRNSTNMPRLWINRITGLDPASPLFEGYEANDRLDPSDAQFVDVIHSNGDGVLRGGFGSLQPMGHVDFYPNGGRVQVGCNSVLLSALSDIIYGKWQSLCNHRRALNFFMDSFELNKCRFRSFNCDSYENYLKGECFDCGVNSEKCSYMGYLANYSKGRGKMYLTTHEEAPFCANQFIIKIVGTKGFKTHWGKVEVTLVTLDGKNESFWLSSMSPQSAGHELGGGQKELSQQQHCMQSLIVAHPVLVNFAQVLLRYTKYKGWIYSGDESWSIDKVFITDSDGQVKSYCGFNTILESHITSRLNLEPGNCSVVEPMGAGANGLISVNDGGGGSSLAGQQVSRAGGADVGAQADGLAIDVTSSPLSQQQSQPQTPPPAPSSQQQQAQPSQSSRTPRFDYLSALPLGHAFQRIATERPSPFTINYNNIPYIASF